MVEAVDVVEVVDVGNVVEVADVVNVVEVIDVERNGQREKLPNIEVIASRSRRDEGVARQRSRREREHRARRAAAAYAAALKRDGIACREAARRLELRPRTLADWFQRERCGTLACQPRGRPCGESSAETRRGVLEAIRDLGPGIGIPALRTVFPDVPPCQLVDLRQAYWDVYRRHNRVALEQLTWHAPGRVWAMDHVKPPTPVDGIYPAVLAVRDLASGMTLDWLPVPDETAATTRGALQALFVEFGAPLVLKSDNGSAFKGEVVRLLADWRVIPLLSPARTPRYNGSCEAGNGALATRTHHQAALAGHAGFWTSDDVEAARRQSNAFHYPDGHGRPTPLEQWESRAPISESERDGFRLTAENLAAQIHEDMESTSQVPLTAADTAAQHRRVIRRALVEHGYLSTKWRFITLPLKPKKSARIT